MALLAAITNEVRHHKFDATAAFYSQAIKFLPNILSFIDTIFDYPTAFSPTMPLLGQLTQDVQSQGSQPDFPLANTGKNAAQALEQLIFIYDDPSFNEGVQKLVVKTLNFFKLVKETGKSDFITTFGAEICIIMKNALEVMRHVTICLLEKRLNFENALLQDMLATLFNYAVPRVKSAAAAALAEICFCIKWECTNALLQILLVQEKAPITSVNLSEVLDGAVDACDLIKSEQAVAVLDCFRLLLPAVDLTMQQFKQVTSAVYQTMASAGRQIEVQGYLSLYTSMLNCKIMEEEEAVIYFKKHSFPKTLQRCEKATRTLVPLAFFVSSIMCRPNYKHKPHFVDLFIDLLYFENGSLDEDELETNYWSCKDSRFDKNNSNLYPSVYHYCKLSRTFLFYTLCKLDANNEIDKRIMEELVKRLLAANFSKDLGRNNCMPASPHHLRRVRIYACSIHVFLASCLEVSYFLAPKSGYQAHQEH